MTQTKMRGKVCVVTGSSSGLGKATALGLAKMGATVILACRDKQRGQAALEEIAARSGNQSLELMLVDLATQDAVRATAGELLGKYQRVDVLINNAGVFKSKRTVTADGLETMFATNHVGAFLLTNLLARTLASQRPRAHFDYYRAVDDACKL